MKKDNIKKAIDLVNQVNAIDSRLEFLNQYTPNIFEIKIKLRGKTSNGWYEEYLRTNIQLESYIVTKLREAAKTERLRLMIELEKL